MLKKRKGEDIHKNSHQLGDFEDYQSSDYEDEDEEEEEEEEEKDSNQNNAAGTQGAQ